MTDQKQCELPKTENGLLTSSIEQAGNNHRGVSLGWVLEKAQVRSEQQFQFLFHLLNMEVGNQRKR